MATKLDIANRALTRCGQEPIIALTDTNKRALLVSAQYDATLREILNDTPWNFATTRVRLSRSTTPLFGYKNSYTFPSTVIRILEINMQDDFRIEGVNALTNYDDNVIPVTITRDGTIARALGTHTYTTGDLINISGAIQSQYNGSSLPITTVGQKTITAISRVGATATATSVAHKYISNDIINISGASQPEYNGTFTITVTGVDSFTYAVTGTPVTPATFVDAIVSNLATTAFTYTVAGSPATPATGTIYATRETSVLYAKVITYASDETYWSPSFVKAFYLKLAEDMAYALVQSAALQGAIIQEAERYLRRARSYNSQEGTPPSRYPDEYTTSLRL